LLRDNATRESVAGALVWLERAAKQGNSSAKLQLAAMLATSPSADIRDPARALGLVDSLEREYKKDPSLWEIRAAANASSGDFRSALKAENQALVEATELGWNVSHLLLRQSLYASQQTWTGNLLEF
jgi:tetratricopeptide (TPR) repeat protein